MIGFLWELSSWLLGGCLLTVSSHGAGEKPGALWFLVSSSKGNNPTTRTSPSWPHLNLITPQRSHLLIPSHEGGLGLQYWRNTFSPWEPWWESLVWGEWGRNRDKGQSWKLLFPGQNQTSGAKETEMATFITTFLLCFKSVFLSLLSLSPLFLPPPSDSFFPLPVKLWRVWQGSQTGFNSYLGLPLGCTILGQGLFFS